MLARGGLRGGVLRNGLNANARQFPKIGRRFQSTVISSEGIADGRILVLPEDHNSLQVPLVEVSFSLEVCPSSNDD
jgi:hypothetical protein